MTTGSFVVASILTNAVEEQFIFYSSSMTVEPQTMVANGTILPLLTYPHGYSGSVPQEVTPLLTQIIGEPTPTFGQLWPR